MLGRAVALEKDRTTVSELQQKYGLQLAGPNGENLITITAQNSKGGVKTVQKKVVIQ